MIGSAITGYFLEAVTLFGIVLVHELGHLAAANGFGWRVREVQLLPFGGVLIVDELGTAPTREELIVSLAGPLQHVWMILVALLMKWVDVGASSWWDYFIEANLMIGLFNLIPVMPLDGGKVMQSLLGYLLSYHNTILYTAWISMILSLAHYCHSHYPTDQRTPPAQYIGHRYFLACIKLVRLSAASLPLFSLSYWSRRPNE